MKKCTRCGKTKRFEEFNRNSANKDGFRYECRDCSREWDRNYYKENTIKRRAQMKRTNKSILERNQNFIKSYLNNNNCIDCGESDIRVLEFDHLPTEDKVGDIGRLVRRLWSIERLKKEISKCDVVCSNCHRKRTYARLDNCWRVNPVGNYG